MVDLFFCEDGVRLLPEYRQRLCQEIMIVLYRAVGVMVQITCYFFHLIDIFCPIGTGINFCFAASVPLLHIFS